MTRLRREKWKGSRSGGAATGSPEAVRNSQPGAGDGSDNSERGSELFEGSEMLKMLKEGFVKWRRIER